MIQKLVPLILVTLISSCAQGRIDVIDKEGNHIGYCSADFNFHFYGAQHAVNYGLYICAKEHIGKGYKISDDSILTNDYSIPDAPNGKAWSKKLAQESFDNGLLNEEKYGYLIAYMEHQYNTALKKYEEELSAGKINQAQYKLQLEKAKQDFEG